MAAGITEIYRFYFTFPDLSARVAPGVIAAACAASTATSVLGSLRGLRRVLRLRPAEAVAERGVVDGHQVVSRGRRRRTGQRAGFNGLRDLFYRDAGGAAARVEKRHARDSVPDQGFPQRHPARHGTKDVRQFQRDDRQFVPAG